MSTMQEDRLQSAAQSKTEWIDRVNPIVIKECRQSLKGKQFRNWFLLVLGICVLIAILSTQDLNRVDGTDSFPWYFGCIAVFALVIVPRGAFTSISSELDEGTWDLVAISPLSTAAIIRGKLMGTFLQSLLFLCGIFPFLVFSYFMRGINLQMAIVCTLILLGLSIVCSTLSVAVAAISPTKRIRAVLGTFLLMFLGYCAITSAVLVGFSLRLSFGPLLMMSSDPKLFWGIMTTIVLMTGTFVHLLYRISVSCLSFPSANKSTAIRISLTIQWILWVGGLTYYFLNEPIGNRSAEIALGALMPLFAQLFLVGMYAATESERISRRVERKLPRKGIRGAMALFYYPGGMRGFLFFVSMVVATCAAGIVLINNSSLPIVGSIWMNSNAAAVLLTGGYLLIFIGTPVAIMSLINRRLTPFTRRVIVLLTLGAASVAPVFLFLLHDGRITDADQYDLLVTNPFYNIVMAADSALFTADRGNAVIWTAGIVSVLTLLVLVLKGRKRSLSPE